MTRLVLQFHARRAEVAQLVTDQVNELYLWVGYETLGSSYSVDLASQGGISEPLCVPSSVGRIILTIHPLDLSQTESSGLLDSNPTSLAILLGKEGPAVIGESALLAMTDDRKSLAAWRRIRKALTASFSRGAWAVNSITGAKRERKSHYISPGAASAASAGVKLAGIADPIRYDPSDF